MRKWIMVIALVLAVLAMGAVVPSSSNACWGGGYYGGYYPAYSGYSYYPSGYGCGGCGWGGLGWSGYGFPRIGLGFGMGYGPGWYY